MTRNRYTRYIVNVVIGIVLLAAVLLAVVSWLFSHHQALPLITNYLSTAWPELSMSKPRGNFRDGVTFDQITWQTDSVRPCGK